MKCVFVAVIDGRFAIHLLVPASSRLPPSLLYRFRSVAGQVMNSTKDSTQSSFVHGTMIVVMITMPVVLASVKTLSVGFELVPTIV